MTRSDAKQAQAPGREPIELSTELVEQIRQEMGVNRPLVVVVVDKDELNEHNGDVEPYVGHSKDTPHSRCGDQEAREPIRAFVSSSVCCVGDRKGIMFRGICYKTPYACN